MDMNGAFASVQDYVMQINWMAPGWDVFIFLFFVMTSLIYGFTLGRDRILIILLSMYMSIAIIHYIPLDFFQDGKLQIHDGFILQLSSFIAIFMVLFFFLSRMGLLKTLGASERFGKIWHIFAFSFLHMGLFIAITLSFLPTELTGQLSGAVYAIFLHQWALFGWLVAPVFVMMMIKREED